MSEAQTVKALPWSSLSLTDREIPWEDLRSVSDAAAESGEVRRRLMADVNALLDRKYNGDETSYHDLEDLAVPAIFAMAAEKLDASGQQEAAKFLIHFLYRAGEADDVFLLEVGERAAGRMGLAILDPAMDLLQTHGSKLECWYHVFSLLEIATKANEDMRDRVRKFCRRVIREAPDRFERWSSIEPAAWTLAAIRDVDSLPFLRTIQQTAQSPELAYAIKKLESADDNSEPAYPHCWETPVEEWLECDVRRMHKWLEEYEANNSVDDEQDAEELEAAARSKHRGEMVRAFEASDAYAALPQSTRDLGLSVADSFLTYLMEYAGASPADMSPMDIDKVLLDLFPRKVSEDREFFQHTPPALVAFFDSLEQTGVIADADPLKEATESCADEMISLSQDPGEWGPAKSFVMAAQQDGVDPSDHAALQQYMVRYNAKLAAEHKRNRPARPVDDSWVRPIVRETRKIGRNHPCPCGSGKKHKKCCGR